MKLKSLVLAVLAAGAALVSCQQEKPVFGISADKDTIEFPQGGGQVSVQVTTAQAWNVNIPIDAQAWLIANPSSGMGSGTITFTAQANDGKDRKTGLKINAGMAGYVSVTVTQPGSQKPGDGLTPETAWSASEARAWITANLASGDVTTDKYYIKGIIHKVQTTFAASGSYGNAVFFISDDGQASSEDFEAYQVYYLEGKQWKKGNPDVAVGDEVIIYGPVTLYNTTPETAGKGAAYIYSHVSKGGGGGGEETDYSKAQPKTVAEFIAAADTETYYKLTGTVSGFNATYCSFDLEDATGKIYVYSVLADYKAEWVSKIKNGGTIVIAGKYDYYEKKSQHEVIDAAILSFEPGQGGGGEETDYSKAEPKTVAEFISAADTETYYKLTGEVSSFNATYCSFDLTDATGTIYVYSVLADYKAEWASKVKNGATIVIAGKYKNYNGKDEVVDAAILSCEGGEDPQGGDFSSNVTWTLGDGGYTQDATVNGTTGVEILKLGTSKKVGTATLTLPSGSSKMTFYAISWNNADVANLVFKAAGSEIATVTPASNSGLAGNPTYTLTVADSDKYQITVPSGVTEITVETSGGYRAALFAINAE